MQREALLAILFAVALGAPPLCAQIVIRNPSLPQEESLVYTESIGGDAWTVTQSLSLKTAKGDSWYEFRSSSPESDIVMRLDPTTLFPRSSEVTSHSVDSLIKRTTEILRMTAQPKANEVVIADFNSLPITLRGLPWGTFTSANILFLGAGGRGFQFSPKLTVAARETVTAGGRSYDCWKVQLGIGGFMGSLMGKSSYWFSADVPHFLVKSESPSGGPGSPLQRWELQSYSAHGR